MHRLTKVLFWITDISAWLLLGFATLAAVTYPFAGPAWARMEHQQLSTAEIAITCLSWVLAAVGAFMVTRRRALGVVLTSAPVLAAAGSNGQWLAGLIACTIPVLFFGTPFLLVFLQARQLRTGTAP